MWADIEREIVERLRERMGAEVTVGTEEEYQSIKELRQKAPAAWVVYDGFTPGAVIPPGTVQQVQLSWWIVVAAKSAKGGGNVQAARDAASALAQRVLAALLGCHLGGGKYLHLSDAPGPEYDAGYCHVPLAFTCDATFKGEP